MSEAEGIKRNEEIKSIKENRKLKAETLKSVENLAKKLANRCSVNEEEVN